MNYTEYSEINSKYLCLYNITACNRYTGIILCMRPASERRRYNVTSSLIGWAHSQNDPWIQWSLARKLVYVMLPRNQRPHLDLLTHRSQVTLECITKQGHQWSRWWLIACFASSHYLNQCWLIIHRTVGNIFQWNLNQNTTIFILEKWI